MPMGQVLGVAPPGGTGSSAPGDSPRAAGETCSQSPRLPAPSAIWCNRALYSSPGNITAALQSWRALSWEVLPATGTGSSCLVN